MDHFTHGLMLGRVLELSETTAEKVDRIESRQAGLIRRIAKLESDRSQSRSKGGPASALRAWLSALVAGLAALEAEQIAKLIGALARLGSP